VITLAIYRCHPSTILLDDAWHDVRELLLKHAVRNSLNLNREAPKWVEYAMAICGSMARCRAALFTGLPCIVCTTSSQTDPEILPPDGKWWSHVGWILRGALHSEAMMLSRYAPDPMRARFYRWIEVWHWLPITCTGIALVVCGTALGGWKLGFRGCCGGHFYGSRSDSMLRGWSTPQPTCGGPAALTTTTHPISATHGMAWWELDFNYWCIRLLSPCRAWKRTSR
jgi:hypothetical protein